MESPGYTINELAELTGLRPRTIHFYIGKGLLPGMGKRGPKTRYPRGHLERLQVIRRLQAEARLTLSEIAAVLPRLGPEAVADLASGTASLASIRPPAADPIDRPDPSTSRAEGARTPAAWRSLAGLTRMRRPAAAQNAKPSTESGAGDRPFPGGSPPGGASRSEPPLTGSPRTELPLTDSSRAKPPSTGSPPAEPPPGEFPPGTAVPAPPAAGPANLAPLLSQLGRLIDVSHLSRSSRRDRWTTIPVTEDLLLSARGLRPHEVSLLERVGDVLRGILERG